MPRSWTIWRGRSLKITASPSQKIGEVYHFSVAKPDALVGEPPLIISGRTLPDVPVTHRPIFQLVPLQVVKAANVTEWINQAYKGHDVKIFSDQPRNAILIMGSPPMVSQVCGGHQDFRPAHHAGALQRTDRTGVPHRRGSG